MRVRFVFALVALGVPASAQDLPTFDDLTSASAIASAAESLESKLGDRLLVRDLLGKELKGADGESVGTIEDLAVVPGGRVIAAIVSTGDGSRIAVPFAAVKLADSASRVEVPVAASELTGMSALGSLATALSK